MSAEAVGVDLFEAIHTLRAIRRFEDRPVDEATIRRLLDAAIRAPSPTNCQPWAFVVVREDDRRTQMADIYSRAWEFSKQFYGDPSKARDETERRMLVATDRLAANLAEAPVYVVACLDRSRLGIMVTPDLETLLEPASAYGSVYAAVQNLLLAARGLGLGAVTTTLHRLFAHETAPLLGLPKHVEIVSVVALGWPRARFGPTTRRSVEEVAHAEQWTEPPT